MHPLKRLFQYATAYRVRIYLASSFSILNKIFDLAPPFLIGLAVDVVVKREASALAVLGIGDLMTQLWVLAGLTVVIWGAESVFEYAHSIYWRFLAQHLQHDLRVDAYSRMQNLDMVYFEDRSTGGLMSVLNDDVNQLERFLDGGANEILQVGTTVVCIGAAFFYWAPQVALFSFSPIPIILFGSFLFQKRLAPRYQKVREAVDVLNGTLANNISGIATIKSYTAEGHEVQRIERESLDYSQANHQAIRLSSAFAPLIRMAVVIGFVATLVMGGWLVFQGQLEVGVYSVLVFITQRLLWPLTRLGQTFDQYQRAMASIRRIFGLMDRPARIGDGHHRPDRIRGEVEFKDVHFGYRQGLPVLNGLSFKVKAGQTVAIVGATGSGKSTILKLLLRFYEAQSGEILVDGVPLPKWNLQSLRQGVGLVSQDVYLFHGSVGDNIGYGGFDADEEQILKAAQTAEAMEFIDRLPSGLDTLVGERGQKLSGGQKQRVAIARAVLKDPPILVLDEATSSVDNETEAAIQRSLERVTVNRTTLVVAHRLSTIRSADCIYVLDGGVISESGTHEELLQRNGIYSSLWKVQTGEAVNISGLGKMAHSNVDGSRA
ncbi:MAG: ABC transporter ATP-binding protein [Bdellovibrionales bacterium]|nr:ABC transporter ATP-binding protein [Bdellovibrionales bacterium]